MLIESVLERIEQEPITVRLVDGHLRVSTLDLAPADYALPRDLVEVLRDATESFAERWRLREFTEGVRRINAQRHLDHLAKDRSFKGWQQLHSWVSKHWPPLNHYFNEEGQLQEDPYLRNAWANLCSWADAHLHIAEAEKDLAQRTEDLRALGARTADLSWTLGDCQW